MIWEKSGTMNVRKLTRCAVYTRKSSEHNLDLAFTSLDAQREACEAYIKSQAHEGWRAIPGRYDDGAFSGASLDRPAGAGQACCPGGGAALSVAGLARAPEWPH